MKPRVWNRGWVGVVLASATLATFTGCDTEDLVIPDPEPRLTRLEGAWELAQATGDNDCASLTAAGR